MNVVLSLILLILFAGSTEAATYHVSVGGTGINCTQYQTQATAAPNIATATACLSSAVGGAPNQIVEVHAGTYSAFATNLPKGTSWNAPFTLRCGAGEICTIRLTGGNFILDTNSGDDWYTIIQGFVFDDVNRDLGSSTNQFSNIFIGSANYIRFTGNTIYDKRTLGMYIGTPSTGVEVLNNTFDGTGGAVDYLYGIYCTGQNVLIQGNTFRDTPAFGVQVYSQHFPPPANVKIVSNTFDRAGRTFGGYAFILSSGDNLQAWNNVIFNGRSGIQIDYGATNAKVYNNSIYGMSEYGMFVGGSSSNAIIKNNIIYNSGFPDYTNNGSSGTTFQFNRCGSGCSGTGVTNGNPLFVNPAAGNLALQAGSLARDTGQDLGSPYNVDFANVSRPQGSGWDMGALEFASATTVTVAITGFSSQTCVNTLTTVGGNTNGACTITGQANNTIALSGTSTQSTGSVAWSCDRCGSGTVTGVSSWTTSTISLKSGVNIVTVTGTDAALNAGTDTIAITYVPTFPGNSLVGAWGFETGSGTTATDSSGNGNNGTLTNGPTWMGTSGGRYGNAISFDGINDSIVVLDANSLDMTQSWTISAWVKPASSQTNFRAILHKNGDTSGPPYDLYASIAAFGSCTSGGTMALTTVNGASGPRYNVCTNTPIPPGNWTFVAATYNNATGQLRLYRSDLNQTAFISTTAATGYIQPSDGSAAQLIIGGSEFGEFFQGALDEVRLYNWAIPLTDGGNTALGSACAFSAGVQTNLTTPSIIGDANCAIAAVAAPTRFEIGAAAGVFEIGAGATFEIQGQ